MLLLLLRLLFALCIVSRYNNRRVLVQHGGWGRTVDGDGNCVGFPLSLLPFFRTQKVRFAISRSFVRSICRLFALGLCFSACRFHLFSLQFMYFHENWFSALLPPGLVLVLLAAVAICLVYPCAAPALASLISVSASLAQFQGRATWTQTHTHTRTHTNTETHRHQRGRNWIRLILLCVCVLLLLALLCFGLFSLCTSRLRLRLRLSPVASSALCYGNLSSSACFSCCSCMFVVVALFAVRSNSLLLAIGCACLGSCLEIRRTELNWLTDDNELILNPRSRTRCCHKFLYLRMCANRHCNVATSSCCRRFRCCCSSVFFLSSVFSSSSRVFWRFVVMPLPKFFWFASRFCYAAAHWIHLYGVALINTYIITKNLEKYFKYIYLFLLIKFIIFKVRLYLLPFGFYSILLCC